MLVISAQRDSVLLSQAAAPPHISAFYLVKNKKFTLLISFGAYATGSTAIGDRERQQQRTRHSAIYMSTARVIIIANITDCTWS